MDDQTITSTVSYIKQSHAVLIALPEALTVDVAAAGLALQAALRHMGKEVTLVTNAGRLPARVHFLPEASAVGVLPAAPELVIVLDTARAKLGELSYETPPGKVRIVLRAKEGSFAPQDVSVEPVTLPYDLVVTVGVQEPENLGALFSEQSQFFYNTPRINIDINPHNGLHGTLNLVSVTRSSVCELCYRVMQALGEASALPAAATQLLAGILSATDSLQNQRTTPDTFAVVADLIAAGADHQRVVRELFKTEQLGFLQLWGRSLARLKILPGSQSAYSVLSAADFEKTGQTAAVAPRLLAELFHYLGDITALLLLVPDSGGSSLFLVINTTDGGVLEELVKALDSPNQMAGWLENGQVYTTLAAKESPEAAEKLLAQVLSVL